MINEFISKVKGEGLARTNRYMVEFNNINGHFIKNGRSLMLYCDSATIPGMNISSTAVRTYGDIWEMPYERTFEPATFTFYVDSKFEIKNTLEQWMDMVINPTNRTIGYLKDYEADITISVLNVNESDYTTKTNDVIPSEPYKIKLYHAYPKSLSPISLGYETKGVMKMSLTVVMNIGVHQQL